MASELDLLGALEAAYDPEVRQEIDDCETWHGMARDTQKLLAAEEVERITRNAKAAGK